MSISSPDPVVETGESPREGPPRLIRLLSLTVGFTVLALFCMVWNAVTSIQQVEHLERRYQRIELVQETIVYLDEVLTMSARMAAATGDPQWEARYRKFEPELTDAIREALTLSSECGAEEVVKRTEAATSALIEMENRAFDLVHHGHLDAARAIVVSGEYDRQKGLFSAGITELNAVLNQSVPQIVENVNRGVTFDLIISAFILSLLISCLIVGRRTTDRWKAALFQKSAELAELNVSLDRKINEQMRDLRGSEEQFRQLAENIQEAFWMTDPKRTSMLYISPAYEQIWGRTCESLMATPRSFLDAVVSEDREAISGKMIMTMKLGQPFTSEYRILRPDGEMRWIRDRGFPIRNATGEVYRYAGIAADITERKRTELSLQLNLAAMEAAEEELRHANTAAEAANRAKHEQFLELEQLYSTAPIGLLLMDRNCRVLRMNQRLAEISGKPVRELLGRTLGEFIPQLAPEIEAVVERVFLSGEPVVDLELHGVLPPDLTTERDWLVSYYPIKSSDGVSSHVSCVVQETTERKKVEVALRQAKASAEAANRSKSEFLANMSHEIRTPMNGILGMTELTLDSVLTDEQRKNLGMVKSSADSLLNVINDILDFSKIEAGKLELDPTPFALRDSLSATVHALGQRAHEKGLELICQIGPKVPDGLVGDALRLRQIITNLVGNAIKFTDRGEVVVQVNVEGTSAETVCLHFTVRDTGMGIPTEKQRVIFEAFTQADASTTRSFGGTGLGLAITSQLVALMGGRIWVESEVGTGSNFHFTIQLEKQLGTSLKLLTGHVNLAQLPVLIVDDNATNRAMLEETLTNWRMCPVGVSDGISAIAAMKQSVAAGSPFPLVLLDAFMPEMDGFAVVEQIKRDPNLAKATIMMLSSADRSGDAARCRKLGVACYLRKPIAPSDLFDAIQVALGAVPSEKQATYPAVTDGTAVAQRSLHILLAEDNEVNQELAVKLLQKHGHTVAIAADGCQALAALERESVDVILMDMQMPVMDGFATTAAVRDREKVTGGHTPIIALTAHAMKGDQERCLAAGMDAYVSKPLRLGELFEAIARVVPVVCERPAMPASIAASAANALPTEAVFDAACALASVEGDSELLVEIISLFVAQSRDLLPEIRSAGERHDGQALEQSAHKLKGSIQNFGDVRASTAALRLETMGHTGEFVETEKALSDLEQEVTSLRDALQTFTEERAACKS